MYCLHAAHITSSGPKSPSRLHLKYLYEYDEGLSSSSGRFRCTADQTQRNRVKTQENNNESVPRPLGSPTYPTSVELRVLGLCNAIDMAQPTQQMKNAETKIYKTKFSRPVV